MLGPCGRRLIVNPFASRVTEQRVRELERRLDAVETLLTERRGHATELAAAARATRSSSSAATASSTRC